MVDDDKVDSVAECNDDSSKLPQEMDHNKNVEQVDRSECRDAVTGRFTAGWKGGGRPQGSKDRFTKRVVDTLEACWDANAEQMLAQLAAEDPKVIMAMVAKLMPSNLIEEDITGIAADASKNNTDVRITLVNQAQDAALTHNDIPKLVEGEVLPPDTTH